MLNLLKEKDELLEELLKTINMFDSFFNSVYLNKYFWHYIYDIFPFNHLISLREIFSRINLFMFKKIFFK